MFVDNNRQQQEHETYAYLVQKGLAELKSKPPIVQFIDDSVRDLLVKGVSRTRKLVANVMIRVFLVRHSQSLAISSVPMTRPIPSAEHLA